MISVILSSIALLAYIGVAVCIVIAVKIFKTADPNDTLEKIYAPLIRVFKIGVALFLCGAILNIISRIINII